MPTDITRRAFVQLAACGLASFHLHGSQPAMTATAAVDHLLLGVPDLEILPEAEDYVPARRQALPRVAVSGAAPPFRHLLD